ncbi:MAG: hypothetical protein KIT84_09780 [Labilithrix sp.]|nr:hypothetical protein [Labilithrix sp.]MCW5811291.1 hypothetical protein [Labilithrix sp.]
MKVRRIIAGVSSVVVAATVVVLSSACDGSSTDNVSSAAEDPTGRARAPSAGCVVVASGCVCAPGTSTIVCGRNQIPTDPVDFRKDVYFVTPCCKSGDWPTEGTCTCENRVGVRCTTTESQCQCGVPFGGFQSAPSGATEPSGGTEGCSKPSDGKCCALPGPNGGAPYLGCFCGTGSSCTDILRGEAIEVDRCDGSNVFSPYCPSGTTELGYCSASPGGGGGGGGGGGSGGCTADSDCGRCQRCVRSSGSCVARLTC